MGGHDSPGAAPEKNVRIKDMEYRIGGRAFPAARALTALLR